MKRFLLSISLLASACGPGMQKHDTTPSAAAQSNGQNNEMVCNDETVDAREAARPRCRRKSDVDADTRAAHDAVNALQTSTRSR